MDDAILPKKPQKYFCEICNYESCNKKDYDRHLMTLKHKNETQELQMDDNLGPQKLCLLTKITINLISFYLDIK